MAEVRDELERVFQAVLQAQVLDIVEHGCPVIVGSAVPDQPDEFVRVTCEEAEHAAGGVYRVDMEISVVVEMDKPNSDVYAAERFGAVCRFFDAKTCPLRTWRDASLAVFGYRVTGQEEQRGTRQIANRLLLKVGAAAIG